MTTDWFWFFLGNQRWLPQRIYSLVFNLFKKLELTFFRNHQKPRSLQIGSAIFLKISTEHRKWLQIGFDFFLEISTDSPKESTIWCSISLKNLNQPFSETIRNQGHYRLVLQFSWKSAQATHEHRKWLQIGFDFFLEISTDSPKESTIWCSICLKNLNQPFSETIRNQGHYRLVLQFSWESALNTENDYKLSPLKFAPRRWEHQSVGCPAYPPTKWYGDTYKMVAPMGVAAYKMVAPGYPTCPPTSSILG